MDTQTPGPSEQANGTVELPDGSWHALMQNVRRRTALRALADRDAPLSLSELADDVVDRREEADDSAAVRTALHHVHLPKLAEVGIVEYDPEANRVTAVRDGSLAPVAL